MCLQFGLIFFFFLGESRFRSLFVVLPVRGPVVERNPDLKLKKKLEMSGVWRSEVGGGGGCWQ